MCCERSPLCGSLRQMLTGWQCCERSLPAFQVLSIEQGLGAWGLQLAEPCLLMEMLLGKWSSHNWLLVQRVMSRMCAEVSDCTYILGCQLNCLEKETSSTGPWLCSAAQAHQ